MKINRLETHDRLEHFTKQQFSIAECCQDLIDQRPFGEYPFYIFAHTRTEEDGATKRLIWQPRLTKPSAQTNSMLFKVYPGTDLVKIIWMIPMEELWDQYKPEKMTHNKTIWDSIYNFRNQRALLESKEDGDLCDAQVDLIYRSLGLEGRKKSKQQKLEPHLIS